MTQFKSIKKPNIKLPIKAPPLPNVNDKAAAITLQNFMQKNQKERKKVKRISKVFEKKNLPIVKYLRLVGNKSTITQYTVLMPSDVRASNIQDNTKFSTEFRTKYNPIVTAPATTKLNTAPIKQKIGRH